MSGYPFFVSILARQPFAAHKAVSQTQFFIRFLYDYAFDNPLIASAQTLKIFLKKVVEKSLTYGENMVSFETYFFCGSKEKYDRKTEYKRPIKKAFFLLAVAIAKKKRLFFVFLSKKRA